MCICGRTMLTTTMLANACRTTARIHCRMSTGQPWKRNVARDGSRAPMRRRPNSRASGGASSIRPDRASPNDTTASSRPQVSSKPGAGSHLSGTPKRPPIAQRDPDSNEDGSVRSLRRQPRQRQHRHEAASVATDAAAGSHRLANSGVGNWRPMIREPCEHIRQRDEQRRHAHAFHHLSSVRSRAVIGSVRIASCGESGRAECQGRNRRRRAADCHCQMTRWRRPASAERTPAGSTRRACGGDSRAAARGRAVHAAESLGCQRARPVFISALQLLQRRRVFADHLSAELFQRLPPRRPAIEQHAGAILLATDDPEHRVPKPGNPAEAAHRAARSAPAAQGWNRTR